MPASARVEADIEAGRGYAKIIVDDDLPEGFAPLFVIRRPGSTLEHLGPDGWQTAEHVWSPQSTAPMPHGIALMVGPDLVRHMENGNYRLTVFDAARTRSIVAPLVWRDIPQPLDLAMPRTGLRRGRGGVAIGGPPVEPKPEAAQAEPSKATQDPPATVSEVPKLEVPKTEEVIEPTPVPPRKWPIYAAIGGLAALIVVAGTYYELVYIPGQHNKAADNDTTDKDKKAKPDTSPAPSSGTPMQQAQTALKDPDLSAQAAVDLAKRLSTLPQSADAAFLLYDYAAEKGDGASALALGGYYDPSSSTDSGSIHKDGAKAAKYYRQAAAAGQADAAARIDALRTWAKNEAAKGNADAAKLAETL